jgi:hypothetical protein
LKICSTANQLLLFSGYPKSRFRSLGELSGFLWQENSRKQNALLDNPPIPVNKRRKSADKMGERMLSVYGKQIKDYITNNICMDDDDSHELYLYAALKESRKRSSSSSSILLLHPLLLVLLQYSKRSLSDSISDLLISEYFSTQSFYWTSYLTTVLSAL